MIHCMINLLLLFQDVAKVIKKFLSCRCCAKDKEGGRDGGCSQNQGDPNAGTISQQAENKGACNTYLSVKSMLPN